MRNVTTRGKRVV